MAIQLIRTVRFKQNEAEQIHDFLKKNPFFDFSSLARLAVIEFIKMPRLHLTGVDIKQTSKVSRKVSKHGAVNGKN